MIDPNSKEDPKFKELIKVGYQYLVFFQIFNHWARAIYKLVTMDTIEEEQLITEVHLWKLRRQTRMLLVRLKATMRETRNPECQSAHEIELRYPFTSLWLLKGRSILSFDLL